MWLPESVFKDNFRVNFQDITAWEKIEAYLQYLT